MTQNIHRRIKNLLEETNDAFESCAGSINTEYAAFVSMRLSEFKNLLENPDLTARQLRQIIRKGQQKSRAKNPEVCWASFIANYMAKYSNQNLEKTIPYGLNKVYKEKP